MVLVTAAAATSLVNLSAPPAADSHEATNLVAANAQTIEVAGVANHPIYVATIAITIAASVHAEETRFFDDAIF